MRAWHRRVKNTHTHTDKRGECCIYKKRRNFIYNFFRGKKRKGKNVKQIVIRGRKINKKSLWRMQTNHVQLSCILYEFSIEGYF